jgi:tetratricopeptide (TPR) repeat protein
MGRAKGVSLRGEARRRALRAGEAAAVFAITLLLYVGIPGVTDGVLSHPFLHWDDSIYIVKNPAIRDLSWENVQRWLTRPYFGNYAPLTLASYALDYAFSGLKPLGYHLTDVLLHAGAAVFALAFFRRLLGPGWPSLVGALLFALHPVQVESVAWASQRKSTLAMFFLLPALLLFLRHRDRTPDGVRARWPTGAYLGSLGCFLLSLLAKGTGVVLPVLLLLHEWLLDPRPRRRGRFVEVTSFFLLALGIGAATLWAQSGAGAVHLRYAFGDLAPTMTVVFADYLRTLFLPTQLNNLYYPEILPSPLRPEFLLSAALLAGVLVLTGRWIRRSPRLAFWSLWFFVSLGPVSNLLPLTVLQADRYLHLPSLALGGLGGEVLRRVARRSAGRRRAVLLGAALVIACFAALTAARIPVWSGPERLWADSVAKAPYSHVAHGSLGEAYADAGDLDRALEAYRTAVRLQPKAGRDFFNIGFIEVRRGNLAEAAKAFRQGLAQTPEPAPWDPAARESYGYIHFYLGVQAVAEGRPAEAEARYRRALAYYPSFPEAAFDLGGLLAGQGREEEAFRAFKRAAALRPGFYEAHREAALAALRGGASREEAARALSAALALRSQGPEAATLRRLLEGLEGHPGAPAQ